MKLKTDKLTLMLFGIGFFGLMNVAMVSNVFGLGSNPISGPISWWTASPAPTQGPISGPVTPTKGPISAPVTPTPTPVVNLLQNGNFNAAQGWTIPSWITSVLKIENGSLHGKGKMSGVYAEQDVATQAGKFLRFSGKIKMAQVNPGMYVTVELQPLNKYNGKIYNSAMSMSFNSQADWSGFNTAITTPKDAAKVRVSVKSNLNGEFFIDDLVLTTN